MWGRFALGLALLAIDPYVASVEQWRHEREASLKAENGWLTVTGLVRLDEGASEVNGVKFERHGARITHNGRELRPDSTDSVRSGSTSLFIIQRGGTYFVRVKDPNSKFRREFRGLEFYPADRKFRIRAKFVPSPGTIPIANIIGQTEPMPSPGYVVFRLDGRDLRLYPVLEEPGAKSLFFIFRDGTAGKETYGAGRFLDTDLPADGVVVLDFNKAYNPPCAFTPYATCPLPPKQNQLPVRIPAGEKKYGGH